ncbi:hypothetical protein B0T14DRAFT_40902 [Immersiella caudata]|uniref:Uncharacterized protein n=1 Tax=Immersiella caudata TaxID=314043 RepID=A0AA40CBW2_9PEZI|nr:hypothetical protein B0T14DRAFT_40902 [Immersiella caudata]
MTPIDWYDSHNRVQPRKTCFFFSCPPLQSSPSSTSRTTSGVGSCDGRRTLLASADRRELLRAWKMPPATPVERPVAGAERTRCNASSSILTDGECISCGDMMPGPACSISLTTVAENERGPEQRRGVWCQCCRAGAPNHNRVILVVVLEGSLVHGLYLESNWSTIAMEGWTKRRNRLGGRSLTDAGFDKRSEACSVGIECGQSSCCFWSRCGGVQAPASFKAARGGGLMDALGVAVQCDAKKVSS